MIKRLGWENVDDHLDSKSHADSSDEESPPHLIVDSSSEEGRQEAMNTTEEEVEERETCSVPCIATGARCGGDRENDGGDK